MSSNSQSTSTPTLDLSKWSNIPLVFIVIGVVVAGGGILISGGGVKQFGFSWLLAFMFALSLCVGGWFLVMMHHLFDASWSVATRRMCEHLACLLCPAMLILFLPIAITAKSIFPWMSELDHPNEALKSKYPLFTMPGFYAVAIFCFAIWFLYSNRLRFWSLRQDETGAAECTHKMRFLAGSGIIFFAITVTLAAIMWMKGLMDDWYSTMYAVTYFAGSIWVTLPTLYFITLLMQRSGPLKALVTENTYYMIGTLFFAFTVFWAYVNFAQYFIVWNANMPDETFWYVLREKGSWDAVGKYVIIFGHFFIPFLMLLRIDFKLKLNVMFSLMVWAWLMHFVDLEFQIMPALHTDGILTWGLIADIGCVLIFVGVLAKVFIASVARHPAYPLKDPRLAEALGIYVPAHSDVSIAPQRAK
jgi:hypothetical protein